MKFAIILWFLVLAGCSAQQVDDAFSMSTYEYDEKYRGGISHWNIEDIHVAVNKIVDDSWYEPRRPELNGYCLETAEMKYEMARIIGYTPDQMEIVTFAINDDTAISRNIDTGLTHAVLRIGNTVYDNGFISETPFDISELNRYGTVIPNIWSTKEYQ